MHKVKVENFYAENTGDDSLAFFNVVVSINKMFFFKTVLCPFSTFVYTGSLGYTARQRAE